MQKKDPADYVFFNIQFTDGQVHEAVAIRKGVIIDLGTIPYIFSNYRGFKDYNAQGKYLQQKKNTLIQIGEAASGLVITENRTIIEREIIWEIISQQCLEKNLSLLDPHWDDH